MDNLKKCPFCGGDHIIAEVNMAEKVFSIYCDSYSDSFGGCTAGMRLPFADAGLGDGDSFTFLELEDIMDEMIELWNKREG